MDIFKVPFQIQNVPQTTLPLISRSNTIYDFFSVRHWAAGFPYLIPTSQFRKNRGHENINFSKNPFLKTALFHKWNFAQPKLT